MIRAIFEAISKALGLAQQNLDPEVIRLARLRDIEDKLRVERIRRDLLLTKEITPENEERYAIELGVVVNNIVRLRKEADSLKK